MTQFILNLVTILLSLSALRYVTGFWILSFFYSFQTHIGLLAICICAPFLFFSKHRLYAGLLVGAGALLALHSLYLKGNFQPAPEIAAETPRFDVLEFNILASNTENASQITDYIVASNADAVFILEASPLSGHLSTLDAAYPYRIGCGNETRTCDVMILSKHPMTASEFRDLSDLRKHRLAMTEVSFQGEPLTLAAAHLSKPYFDEYHQLELSRLRRFVGGKEGQLILGGDFNSSVLAPDMQDMIKAERLDRANGEPATWPVELGPLGIGIDHIFVREPGKIETLERLRDNMGSNHFGLRARTALPQN